MIFASKLIDDGRTLIVGGGSTIVNARLRQVKYQDYGFWESPDGLKKAYLCFGDVEIPPRVTAEICDHLGIPIPEDK